MENATEKKKGSPVKFIVVGAVLIIGGYFGFQKVNFSLTHETTDNAQVETQITPILPRVAGYVKTIAVKDYDSVKAGDLLVELDDAELQQQLEEMQADFTQAAVDIVNAKAALNNAIVSLKINKGNIDISNLRKQKANDDLKRDQSLYTSEAITKKQLDDTKFAAENAAKILDNSVIDLTAAESKIAVLKANVSKAEAVMAVKQSHINQQKLKLSYTKIYATQAGKIGKKTISEGQFVQAGTPLFSIVNDSTYWVVGNFKESQLYVLFPGKKVKIRIDAYPDLDVTGTVASLSEATGAKFALLPPDNSSGNFVKVTQRVPVKIWIDNVAQYKNILRAGLSIYIVANNK
ncbi:MAG: HlyD family secretion protein [Sediminibacterium sp.]|jgi:membrane fusion protein (multidrug efflux system)|nr:MAG: HlyD family secretion protein [Sediminibacterium sp.]